MYTKDLLKTNIRYLLSTLEYTETKKFTEAIGVNPSTVTRWKSGINLPDRYCQKQICAYFGIESIAVLYDKDLTENSNAIPLLQKKEILAVIEQMDFQQIKEIYSEFMKTYSRKE